LVNKLDIGYEMAQLDLRNRQFYDELNDEERKKFSTYLMLRWGSVVNGIPELQQYYLQAMNERVNKRFFDINRHPKLQWLLLTTVSPNMGKHRHEWMAYSSKTVKNKRAQKMLELYPHIKSDEAELLADKITDQQYKGMLVERGYSDKEIKEAMK
jgi:ribonuclease I